MTREDATLQERTSLHRDILDQLQEGVYLVDRNRKIIYWNQSAARISGYESSEVIGSSCADNLLIHIDEQGRSLCLGSCPLEKTMKDGETREAKVYLHHKDGHRVSVWVRTAPLRDDEGNTIGGIEIFSEHSTTTDLEVEIEELRKLALQDQLTGIGNRRYTEMMLQSRQSEFLRYGWDYGLLMIDIDQFKRFNDQHGHDVGDKVLQMVARTLASNVRTHDIVGRWGGEEFLAILEKIEPQELASRAEILRKLVEASGFEADGKQISVTISSGGTLIRTNETPEEALKRADSFLYKSKEAGRNRSTVAA